MSTLVLVSPQIRPLTEHCLPPAPSCRLPQLSQHPLWARSECRDALLFPSQPQAVRSAASASSVQRVPRLMPCDGSLLTLAGGTSTGSWQPPPRHVQVHVPQAHPSFYVLRPPPVPTCFSTVSLPFPCPAPTHTRALTHTHAHTLKDSTPRGEQQEAVWSPIPAQSLLPFRLFFPSPAGWVFFLTSTRASPIYQPGMASAVF